MDRYRQLQEVLKSSMRVQVHPTFALQNDITDDGYVADASTNHKDWAPRRAFDENLGEGSGTLLLLC